MCSIACPFLKAGSADLLTAYFATIYDMLVVLVTEIAFGCVYVYLCEVFVNLWSHESLGQLFCLGLEAGIERGPPDRSL